MENNNLKDVFVEGEIIDIVEVSKKGKLLKGALIATGIAAVGALGVMALKKVKSNKGTSSNVEVELDDTVEEDIEFETMEDDK